MEELYIIQVMAHKIYVAGISGTTHNIKADSVLKIHPVLAENGEEAIKKLQNWYKDNKPNWEMRLVDTEPLIK